jgi:hypothetical protein
MTDDPMTDDPVTDDPVTDDRDAGSTLPLVLLCFLLALLLVAGTVAASSAFLAQRDLQSDCDGAAVAGAGAIDPGAVYGGGPGLPAELPVTEAAAQTAVEGYAARAGLAATTFAVTVSADGGEVGVACGRTVRVPFGAMFGLGDGLDRTAGSRARSPLRP